MGRKVLTIGPEAADSGSKSEFVGDISTSDALMPEAPTNPVRTRKQKGVVYIDWDRCKGCGFCVEFCPPKVLALSEKYNTHGYHPPELINQAGCTGCDLCGLYCPDFAIFGTRVPVETSEVRSE